MGAMTEWMMPAHIRGRADRWPLWIAFREHFRSAWTGEDERVFIAGWDAARRLDDETIARVIDSIREIARECGYAIAVHGSKKRDLDLIAVPWTDGAVGNRALVDALCAEVPLVLTSKAGKPHGRMGYVLHGVDGFDYVDLSVTPRRSEFSDWLGDEHPDNEIGH